MSTVIPLIEVQGSLIETFNKGATMDATASKPDDILVDRDKFDAVLRNIITTGPLPLKDVIGTSRRGKRAESASYSIFDSALYRNLEAEWIFPQEKATLQDLQTATCESKML